MFFKYRSAQVRDLPECRRCLRDHFVYDAAALDDLSTLWRELIVSGAGNAAVIEDLNRPVGQRIVWYCITVFITPEYAAYLRTDAPPMIGRGVLERWRAGCSPLLDLAQVRRANSGGGITMMVMNSGATPEIMGCPVEMAEIAGKVHDHTYWSVGGYRLNEVLIEMYTDYECAWAEGYGFCVRTDYQSQLAEHRPAWLPEGCRPRLYGATRREAEAKAGCPLLDMFRYKPPRFLFSPLEQELLQCALFGDTDNELAEFLSISPATLKKRWLSIYDSVAAADEMLLGEVGEMGKRGMEKKRHLLQYLRHHPEELRPYCSLKG